MSDETTLLPCPWCGEYPKLAEDGGSTGPWFCVWHDCPPVEGGKARHYGESLGCVSITTAWFDTEAEAIAAWNTRVDTEYGGIPATEENMAKHGWVREEIVRCRDCVHSRKDGTLCMYFASWEPIPGGDEYAEVPADVEPDGFCVLSVKRRKEGGE